MAAISKEQLQAIIDTPNADINSMLVADIMALTVALQKQVKVLAQALLNMTNS